jgi:predicted amidohydrolase YtcJ
MIKKSFFALAITVGVAACAPQSPEPGRTADTIYYGGDIVTVNDAQPTAAAVALKDGKILAVGSADDVLATKGSSTKVVDLGGKTMIPGIIDGHSHFFQAAQIADYVNVSAPPVGTATSIAEIVVLLEDRVAEEPLQPGEWLIGYGYDRNPLSDGREMVREDLDKEFPDNPVVLVHVSGHGGILNSAAFEAVGIDAKTPTPDGGVIVRRPGRNEPAGLLMETAWFQVLMAIPKRTEEQTLANLEQAQAMYAANGITTMVDAPMEPGVFALYKRAANQGLFRLDLISYCGDQDLAELVKEGFDFGQEYKGHWRVPGVKTFIDGSPQGKTAFFTEPFLTGGPGGEKDYRGEFMVSQDKLNSILELAYAHDAQVLVHANGDGAIDMLLEAHESAGAPEGRRTVPIHSQFVRRDQLEKYAAHGFVPSFFTNHAFFWGDVHVENLGRDRAYFLSPMKTARSMGLHMTNHSDFMVTPLDPMFILWTSVNRVSRSGQVIGPDERVWPLEGLKALTLGGAYQYFEEDRKGSIEVGKLADLVILDKNPLNVDPMTIKDIQIIETIKEGETIYTKS